MYLHHLDEADLRTVEDRFDLMFSLLFLFLNILLQFKDRKNKICSTCDHKQLTHNNNNLLP